MPTRTLVIVLLLTGLFFTTTFAMRGRGHKLASLMSSIHGR